MILVTGTHRRGAEVFGDDLSTALRQRGWECDFVALKDSGTSVSVSATPLRQGEMNLSRFNWRVIGGLRSRIVRTDPKVILAGGGATLKYSSLALVGLRSKPVLVYSSIGEPEYWARSSWKRAVVTRFLRSARLITAVSRATADQLVRSFGVHSEKIRIAQTGVDERFLGIPMSEKSDVLRILFLGSLTAEKNPLAAVEAFSLMKSPGELRLVGGGQQLGPLRNLQTKGLEVFGPAEDVAPHLTWADVLIVPSLTEGTPGVILEAGASGVPVVAFGVGGIGEIVEHGVTGLIVESGDVAALAGALDQLSADAPLIRAMSAKAKAKIEEMYLMQHAVDRYEKVLQEACKLAQSIS
jgi:glycosyltransferase involved in cell wall biosynthesis